MWSFCRTYGTGICRCSWIELTPPSRSSGGRKRIRTCRRTLIRDLQIFRAVKRREWQRDSADRFGSALFGVLRENATADPGVPDARERSIHETKCRTYTFLYVAIRRAIQLRRSSHTGICNILREQSSSRDRQCMRSHGSPNDIYIYIDTALNGILNNGGMLKCICDRGLTTGPEFFRCRIGARKRAKWYMRGRIASRNGRRNENSTRLSFHVTNTPTLARMARGTSTPVRDTFSINYSRQKLIFYLQKQNNTS